MHREKPVRFKGYVFHEMLLPQQTARGWPWESLRTKSVFSSSGVETSSKNSKMSVLIAPGSAFELPSADATSCPHFLSALKSLWKVLCHPLSEEFRRSRVLDFNDLGMLRKRISFGNPVWFNKRFIHRMQFVSAYRSGKPVIKSICGFPRCVSELLTPPQSPNPGSAPCLPTTWAVISCFRV